MSTLTDLFTDIANAIRGKKGTSDTIPAQNFASEITNLPSGEDIEDYITTTLVSGSFALCRSIKKLPPLTITSSVTSLASAFYYCSKLTRIEFTSINTSNVTSLSGTFRYCSKLENIVITDGGVFNCGKVNTVTNFIASASNIETLPQLLNLGQAYTSTTVDYANYSLNLSPSSKITYETLINIIDGLYDLETAGKAHQSLILGSTNLAKLTAAEIAVATNKGWNVS